MLKRTKKDKKDQNEIYKCAKNRIKQMRQGFLNAR